MQTSFASRYFSEQYSQETSASVEVIILLGWAALQLS
jgi:hypothetical protein